MHGIDAKLMKVATDRILENRWKRARVHQALASMSCVAQPALMWPRFQRGEKAEGKQTEKSTTMVEIQTDCTGRYMGA